MPTVSVLFVCLGNICRSPTAEGVFTSVAKKSGLISELTIDSAGTSGWHIGEGPDPRTVKAAAKRGVKLSHLRGRKAVVEDFSKFDYILAMDHENLRNLEAIKPSGYQGHLGLFLAFAQNYQEDEVPDPYYGGENGFTFVLDLIEDASLGFLEHLRAHHDFNP